MTKKGLNHELKRCSDGSIALHTDCLNAGVYRIVNQLGKHSVVLLLKNWSTDNSILKITQKEDANDGAQQSANTHSNSTKKNEKDSAATKSR